MVNLYKSGDSISEIARQYSISRQRVYQILREEILEYGTRRIYNKAHVEIRFGYKQSFGVQFESNEEAQEYVDELIASSDKTFHVIINK